MNERDVKTDAFRAEPWRGAFDPSATAGDIAACFRLLLGRNPSREEWPGHSALAGSPLEHVVAGYVNSLEFQNRGLVRNSLGGFVFRELEGFRLLVSPEDLHIGRPILESGIYEPHVARIFREVVTPGATVVDVGANVGYFTCLAASIAGPEGRVFAFEPGPQNVRALIASREANGFAQVEVLPVAASDRVEVLRFANTFSNGFVSPDLPRETGDLLASTFVLGLPVDLLVPESARVALVKVDTEGFEHRVLAGARRTIERCRPVILSEFSPPALRSGSGVEPERFLVELLAPGYTVTVLGKDGAAEVCGTDAARVLDAFERSGLDHVDLLAAPA